MVTAKVFQSGGSQAVRIPKQFRFTTDTVFIKATEDGLLLIPKHQAHWETFFAKLDKLQQEIGAWDVEPEEIEDLPQQERDWDGLFD